ncbi:MAG TPA: cytochrome C oxidase subunit IV family protein [Steroidobacteraceae bacterium]|nr:cytochrome C oxidase subunit IV family protein [Steroidobacteraceae bacterium]
MKSLILTRMTLTWMILSSVTIFSWAVSHSPGVTSPRYASVIIIVVALFKARLVILNFMEVRLAPRMMRLIADAWIALLGVSLIGLVQ